MLGFLKNKGHAPPLSAELSARLDGGANVIVLADKVRMVMHLQGHVPGVSSSWSTARSRGAFVLTTNQVIATFATRSDPHVVALDSRWESDRGLAVMTVGAQGVRIEIALHGIDPAFSGSMTLNYKYPLTDETLAQLPATRLRGSVDRRSVYLAAGVRPRP